MPTHEATTPQLGVFSGGMGSSPAATWSWCHSCSARPLSTWAMSASPARPSRVRPSASRRPGTLFTRRRGSAQACRNAVRSRSGTSVCMYWSNLEEDQGAWPGALLQVPSNRGFSLLPGDPHPGSGGGPAAASRIKPLGQDPPARQRQGP